MQSQLGFAPLIREAYRNHCLMEGPTAVIFEGIGKDEPLWLDYFLINAALSLYHPLIFACRDVPAALALMRGRGPSLRSHGMAVDELRKYLRRAHGYAPGSSRPRVCRAGDHGAAVRTPPLHQMM